jgi:NitT/TauT family transport system permease protein
MNWIRIITRPSRTQSVVGVLVGTLVIWEAMVWLFQPPPFLLPPPSAVAREVAGAPSWYAKHAMYTFGSASLGFIMAVTIGVIMAIGIVYSRFLENTLFTFLVAINSVPKIALAPLFVVWFGTGLQSKIAVATIIAIFPMVINTVQGLRSVDADILELSRSLRATAFQALFRIRFPSALPSIFSGLKLSMTFAIVGTIAGEFITSEVGLGYVILLSQGNFQTDRVFAALILLGVCGSSIFFILNALERIALPWHTYHRTEQNTQSPM